MIPKGIERPGPAFGKLRKGIVETINILSLSAFWTYFAFHLSIGCEAGRCCDLF